MKGYWLEVSVHVPENTPLRDLAAEALSELYGGAVEERDDALVTHVRPANDPARILWQVRQRLAAPFAGAPMPRIEWRWLEDEDWLGRWRESLRARRVGEHLIVAPPGAGITADVAAVVIRIEPGMAFGTAEHASTRGALKLLESAVEAGDRVLDVGAGSGILAIAAAKRGAAPVLAVEADADAARTARENVKRNNVHRDVRVLHDTVDAAWLDNRPAIPYGMIVANILSGVLLPLLPAFARALEPAGRLILGGIIRGEADRVRAAAARANFTFIAEDSEDAWWTGLFRVRRAD